MYCVKFRKLRLYKSKSGEILERICGKFRMRPNKSHTVLFWIMAASLLVTMLCMSLICQQEVKLHIAQWHKLIPQKYCNCAEVKSLTDTGTVGETGPMFIVGKAHGNDSDKVPCKLKQTSLQGKLHISDTVTVTEIYNAQVVGNVKYGGVYRPPDCYTEQKVAVIIPYRDRAHQLEILLHMLHNMMQRQKLTYGIFVVEMALPVQFNRGLLANAGFLTANSIGRYTCYIVHDVDLIPVNDKNIYNCGSSPRHLVTSNKKYINNGGMPYKKYVGGVLSLTRSQYQQLNGFSNLFFGWGGEDDDMFRRIQLCNMSIVRPDTTIGEYVALNHDEDISNPANPYRWALLTQTVMKKDRDGLKAINYHRMAVEFRPLYTWILIKCNESEVMQAYGHLQAPSGLMHRTKEKKKKQMSIIQKEGGKIVNHKIVEA